MALGVSPSHNVKRYFVGISQECGYSGFMVVGFSTGSFYRTRLESPPIPWKITYEIPHKYKSQKAPGGLPFLP